MEMNIFSMLNVAKKSILREKAAHFCGEPVDRCRKLIISCIINWWALQEHFAGTRTGS